MRAPQDLPPRPIRLPLNRRRIWVVAVVVLLVILFASLKSLATLYTDSLWFSSVGLHRVWSTLLGVKVGLFATFGAVFFALVWVNLVICDRLAGGSEPFDPEDEMVRRYQQAVRPYTGKVHVVVALLLALIGASGTIGQWNNWILFTHATNFGSKDPQFHKDVGFYVFTLPFLSFLIGWMLVALVVTLVVTAVFHYLNGGIRPQRAVPRVRPVVKVHLSVILALIAIVKAIGYYFQRYELAVSTNGYVEGPGYTDVHARLPALEILIFVSIFAAVILLLNIRLQGWRLPIVAIGIWAFVALAIGVIYPALLQVLKVNPAQSTLEQPYIADNIQATRTAYGLNHVQVSKFGGSTTLAPSEVSANATTLNNIRVWDPDPTVSLLTMQKLQSIRSYYTFQSDGVDRYTIGGTLRPVIVGVRQLNPSDLPSSSWVNSHLEYTHGEGVVIAPANQEATGNPVFAVQGVPPTSTTGLPQVTQPNVYFGTNNPGYVIADSRQPELNYQTSTGADVLSKYQGSGGVKMSSWLSRAAFAIRLGDLNVLISNLVTPQSRMLFVRDVMSMARKAAPFLSFDADPYAAVVNGHIDWILDAYTTTSQYPYSEDASTQQVPPGSGLPGGFNYIRNSVKVVIDSYSGKMTYYAMDNDPILRAYESAFPKMFVPSSGMTAALRSHLRYPEDLFSIQAAIYGRYHIASPANFYNAGDAWILSPTAGAGSPTDALAVTITTDAQGQQISGSFERMAPLYQVLEEPGTTGQAFTISDAYVPVTSKGTNQLLTAFLMANSNPGQYGQLKAYETPPGRSVVGPALAESEITQAKTVSSKISLLNRDGSHVILGNILMVPIDQSMLYVRPLYVVSKGNPQPQLTDVIVILDHRVIMATTLSGALTELLGTPAGTGSTVSSTGSPTPGSPTSTPSPSTAATVGKAVTVLKQAVAEYTKAQTALKAGTLAAYQSDIDAMNKLDQTAQAVLSQAGGTATSTSATSPASTGAPTTGSSTTTPSVTTTTSGGTTKSGSRRTKKSTARVTAHRSTSVTTTTGRISSALPTSRSRTPQHTAVG